MTFVESKQGLPWPLVNNKWIAAQREDPRFVLLDATVDLPSPLFDADDRPANGFKRWKEVHIPGSRHADLNDALAAEHPICSFMNPPAEELAHGLEELGISDNSRIAVYDSGDGLWSARLWWMLRSIGLDAAILDGGLRAWLDGGLPFESGEAESASRGTIHPRPQPNAWADRSDVQAVLDGRLDAVLVCGLSEAVFRGDVPTRYSRRGHIPQSANLPARSLYEDAASRLRPVEELRALAAPLLAEKSPLILYCGGGISASVDALVLTILGRRDISIYDGSLQEWSADPALPLELGPAAVARS